MFRELGLTTGKQCTSKTGGVVPNAWVLYLDFLKGLGYPTYCRPLIKPPSLSGAYKRDPNIRALERRNREDSEFRVKELEVCACQHV